MKIEKRLSTFIQDVARFYTKNKLFAQKIVCRPTKSERTKNQDYIYKISQTKDTFGDRMYVIQQREKKK